MQGLGSGIAPEGVDTICEGPLTQEPPGSSAIRLISFFSFKKCHGGPIIHYALLGRDLNKSCCVGEGRAWSWNAQEPD